MRKKSVAPQAARRAAPRPRCGRFALFFLESRAIFEELGGFREAGRFSRSWAVSEKLGDFREAMWFPRSWIVSGELSGFWKAGWKPSGPLFTGLRPGMTTALAFFPAAPVKTLGALPPIPCKLLKKFDQNFYALRVPESWGFSEDRPILRPIALAERKRAACPVRPRTNFYALRDIHF